MGTEEIFQRIQANNTRGEDIVKFIRKELPALQKAASQKQQDAAVSAIKEKNLQLKSELEFWKKRVVELEVTSGVAQYPVPSDTNRVSMTKEEPLEKKPSLKIEDNAPEKNASISKNSSSQNSTQPKKEAKEGSKAKAPKGTKPDKQQAEENKEVNVSRLNLRVGRILNAKKHPDAESLYVEEIDVGEDKPRTVVSGLVKFVPLEEMQNRLVVVLCNLKPAKMRGITSEAMVMCASTPDKVEILSPPPNSNPGDRVICDEYPGEPDSLLNPKKKIFEQVAPDLKTDGSCSATYKLSPLTIAGKGVVKSASLTNVQIK